MSGARLPLARPDGGNAIQLPSATSPEMMNSAHAIAVMLVLAHKLRIEIWCKLVTHGATGLTAGAIATQLKVAPSSLSFHLNQMAKVGALKRRHDGRHSIYSVHTELVVALCAFLAGTIARDPC